jgi:hypothetical protein
MICQISLPMRLMRNIVERKENAYIQKLSLPMRLPLSTGCVNASVHGCSQLQSYAPNGFVCFGRTLVEKFPSVIQDGRGHCRPRPENCHRARYRLLVDYAVKKDLKHTWYLLYEFACIRSNNSNAVSLCCCECRTRVKVSGCVETTISSSRSLNKASVLKSIPERTDKESHTIPSNENSIVTAPFHLSYLSSCSSKRTCVKLCQAALEVRRHYPQCPTEREQSQ